MALKKLMEIPVELVLTLSRLKNIKNITICGYRIKLDTDRYENFLKNGIVCKHCGIVGTKAFIERNTRNDNPSKSKGEDYEMPHINIYGERADGSLVLFTKDHIFPRSKGGKDSVDNYQTLCEKCNGNKRDKTELNLEAAFNAGYVDIKTIEKMLIEQKKRIAQLAKQNNSYYNMLFNNNNKRKRK